MPIFYLFPLYSCSIAIGQQTVRLFFGSYVYAPRRCAYYLTCLLPVIKLRIILHCIDTYCRRDRLLSARIISQLSLLVIKDIIIYTHILPYFSDLTQPHKAYIIHTHGPVSASTGKGGQCKHTGGSSPQIRKLKLNAENKTESYNGSLAFAA